MDHLLKRHGLPPLGGYGSSAYRGVRKTSRSRGYWTFYFYIYDSYSEELQRIRQSKREVEREIKREKKRLKEEIEEELNIKLRPDGSILLSKDERELIEKNRRAS